MSEIQAIQKIKGKIALTVLATIAVTFFAAYGMVWIVNYLSGSFLNWWMVLISASVYAGIQIMLLLLLGPWSVEGQFGSKLNFITQGDNPKVWNMVEKMSEEVKVKFSKVGILNTTELNAFVYWGIGYGNAIVFTNGIIDLLDEEELSGVCGHELGHVTHGDLKAMSFLSSLPIFLHTFYHFSQSEGKYKKDSAAWLLIYLIFIGALIACHFLSLYLSRQREYHADANATIMKKSPIPIAAALAKITYKNISKGEMDLAVRKELNTLCIIDPHSVARQTKEIANTIKSISEIADYIDDPDIDQGDLEEEMEKEKQRGGEMERTHPLTVNRITFIVELARESGFI